MSIKKTPNQEKQYFDGNIIKASLSKVLVPFYPYAGRLKLNDSNDRYEIDCNAEGALFVEVETEHTLADFGEFNPCSKLDKVMIPKCDYSGGLSSLPLLMVQLTRYQCGGVTLGFATHHHVGDGATVFHLLNSRARMARGLELLVPPVHDRMVHFAARNPPHIKFRHIECEPPVVLPSLPRELSDSRTTQSMFKLSKDQIEAIKLQAQCSESKNDNKLSTYEVIAAHVWRSVCKARQLADDMVVYIRIPLDGRLRLYNPSMPKGYCGNVIFSALNEAKVSDIISYPLGILATKIHEALGNMGNEDYLRSSIDYIESQKSGLPKPFLTAHKSFYPNFFLNSWMKLPYKGNDYGWGEPVFFGNSTITYEGQSFLFPSSNEDGSLCLAINLFSVHMPLFEKLLYGFLSSSL